MSARTTLILGALVACLAFASPASATPAVPTSVFDPNETGWLSYRNLTSSQFAVQVRRPEGRPHGDRPRGRRDRRRLPRRGGLQEELRRARLGQPAQPDQRRVPRALDALPRPRLPARRPGDLRAQRRPAVRRRLESRTASGFGWASYRGVTSAEFSEKFDHYRDRGYLPIDFEVYKVGGELRHGAIWVENRRVARLEAQAQHDVGAVLEHVRHLRRRGPAQPRLRGDRDRQRPPLCRHLRREPQQARLVPVPRPHRHPVPQPLEPALRQGLPARQLREVRVELGRPLLRHLAPELQPAELAAARRRRRGRQGRARRARRAGHRRRRSPTTASSCTSAAPATRTSPTTSGCTAAR